MHIGNHDTIESLRRELQRNGQLRDVCGFDPLLGSRAVPSSSVYSRFLYSVINQQPLIDQMFERMVNEYGELHPDFGQVLAIDGKALPSFAPGEKKNGCAEDDHRGEHDARWGKHEYKGTHEKGTAWETVKRWFGFTLHLVVDANHELPVGCEITDATANEMPVANLLLDSLAEDFEWLMERCEYLCGDRGLDDGKIVSRSWDEYGIKPVIDIRNCWKDPDDTKLVPGTENVVYDYAGMDECAIKHAVRIPLSVDRRVFTPLARSSYKWQDIYDKRTAVERANSRLDTSFGFEHHTIRGLKKMQQFRVSLVRCVMLAIAIGWTKKERPELVRSLLKAG